MNRQESAQALLKIAYGCLDPRTGALNLEKFWQKAQEAEITVFSTVDNKRNQVSGLVRALERDALVEPLAELKAKAASCDQESYGAMLDELAKAGRLPIAVEHARKTTDLKDMRLVVATL